MEIFRRQKIIFFLACLISLSLHLCLLILNYKSLTKLISPNLTASSTIPLVLDLQQPQDTPKIQNVNLISKNNQRGSGQITPKSKTPLNEQHLLGQTYQLIIQNEKKKSTPPNNLYPLKKHQTQLNKLTESAKKQQQEKKAKQKKDSPLTKEKESNKNEENINTGIETINSFTMQFNFDNSNLKKIGINAHLESDFINNLARIFNKQLKAYFVNHPQNFFFLSADKVMVLATVDQKGQIAFVDYLNQSKAQTYMNYLIKKMVDNPEKLSFLPTILKRGKQEYIHLTVQISYSGPPLYHITYTIGQQ